MEALKVLVGADASATLSGRLLAMDAADARFRVVRVRGRRDDCAACGTAMEEWSLGRCAAELRRGGVSAAEGASPGAEGEGPADGVACLPCGAGGGSSAASGVSGGASSGEAEEVGPAMLLPLAPRTAGVVGAAASALYLPAGGAAEELGGGRLAACDGASLRCLVVDVRSALQRAISRVPGTLHIPLSSVRAGTDAAAGRVREAMAEAGAASVACVCRRGVDSLAAAALLRGAGVPAVSVRGGLLAFARECDPDFPAF